MPTICPFEGWRDPLVFRVPEPRQGLYLQGGVGGIRQRGRSAYTSHGFLQGSGKCQGRAQVIKYQGVYSLAPISKHGFINRHTSFI